MACLGVAQAELTQHYPQPGWVEHDAEEIWDGHSVAPRRWWPRPAGLSDRRDRDHQPAGDGVLLVAEDGQGAEPCDRLARPADGGDLRG